MWEGLGAPLCPSKEGRGLWEAPRAVTVLLETGAVLLRSKWWQGNLWVSSKPGGRHWKFARGRLEVAEVEGRLGERGVFQGWGCRVLHSARPVAGCSLQDCPPLPSLLPAPWHFLGPRLLLTTTHSLISSLLSPPSCPAAPMALASVRDPGCAQSALVELEGRVDGLPFGQLPVVITHIHPAPSPHPSPKAHVSGVLYIADPFPGALISASLLMRGDPTASVLSEDAGGLGPDTGSLALGTCYSDSG